MSDVVHGDPDNSQGPSDSHALAGPMTNSVGSSPA